MEIILKQDVANLGNKDDIIKVKNGYATNFLIPQGIASMATVTAKKIHAENMRQRAHKEAQIRAEAEALAAKLNAANVTLATKVSSKGKIFGSVNNIQVAEALEAQGISVERKNITLPKDTIKEVGEYEVAVKCYKDIKATVKVTVVAESEKKAE